MLREAATSREDAAAAAAAIFASVTRNRRAGLCRIIFRDRPRPTQPERERLSCDAAGSLRKLGEDVSEVLEYVPGTFRKSIRHVRPKLSCTKCDVIVQAEAPAVRLHAASPVLDCWRMFWSRSMRITSRCIVRRRSTHERVWSWSGRHWRIGSERRVSCWCP